MASTQVLIVGAGPTGLVLALSLAQQRIRFHCIDENAGPGEHSRAMAVQARTLEFYRQFGFADEMAQQGIKAAVAHLRDYGREILTVDLGDLGGGITPYPFVLTYPQDDHERLLIEKLKAVGGQVERNAKLTGFTQDSAGVRATIVHPDGNTEEIEADYICGCDGAHSQVRQAMQVGFSGGTYEQLFYVADVKIAAGFQRDLFTSLGEHILALMFPVRSTGMQRLIGLVPRELSDRDDLTFEELRKQVEPLLDIKVTEVNWFSHYRVHHRVAERFRVGRAFLLGDAGHIHSPVGGQGMNTGIGDAVNLGWKLGNVSRGQADDTLLDTFEQERIGFARALVSTTDRAFTYLAAEGVRGAFVRQVVAPLFFTIATRTAIGRHEFFRFLSQTEIQYEKSSFSEGKAGHVHGGDRLPWIGSTAEDNFDPLHSLRWQVHVYGEPADDLVPVCQSLRLPTHFFSWTGAAQQAGFERDAAYLVRPDGYVALAAARLDASVKLKTFAEKHKLTFGDRISDNRS